MKVRSHLSDRVDRLFGLKAVHRLPAVLVTTQPDVFYFTHFTGDDSWALLTPRKTTIFTDGRYTLQAQQQAPHARTIVRKGPMVKYLIGALKKSGIRRVGFVAEDVSVDLMDRLHQSGKAVTWRSVAKNNILELRQIKSATELSRIRQALTIAQKSFLGLLRHLKPGMTEAQAAAELEYRMRSAGAEKSAFDIIVADGRNSAKPHASATSAKLRAGQPIVIDFGARVGQYCCDLTRTVWLGTMSPRFREIYKICLEAQWAAIARIRTGVPAAEIDQAARKVIARAGYGRYFVHSVGHGIGLDVHEPPALHAKSDAILQDGMVVTVEPGIYIPGTGGVRIEDDVLVQSRGCRVLSDLPKDIDHVVL